MTNVFGGGEGGVDMDMEIERASEVGSGGEGLFCKTALGSFPTSCALKLQWRVKIFWGGAQRGGGRWGLVFSTRSS